MGIFKERRTSLPAMNIKVSNDENVTKSEIAPLNTEYLYKMSTPDGVDIATSYENQRYICLVRLEPVSRDETLYCIRIATNHPSFHLKNSCAYRSFSSWYYLQDLISNYFQNVCIDKLPSKHLLWIKNKKIKLQEIASFLEKILANRQLFNNRMIQMFLQSQMSLELITDCFIGNKLQEIEDLELPLSNNESKTSSIKNMNIEMSQKTYHGPSSSDSHKSVQNLFSKRKSVVHPTLHPLAEGKNESDKSPKSRFNIVY